MIRRTLLATLGLAATVLLSSTASARTIVSTYSLEAGEVPSLPDRTQAPLAVSKGKTVDRLKIESEDTRLRIRPADTRTCVSLNGSDVRPQHHLQASGGLTAVRAERVDYTDDGAELSIHDYWVDASRGGVTLAKVTRIPLTHLISKLDVEVFAFRDGSALEVVAATHRGVVIDTQVDSARCAHARGRMAANPKDGGILRYIVAVTRPGAEFELDETRRHSVSSEERFRQLMTAVNVTVSISQLSRDRAPVISAVVGRADENTLQFAPGFVTFDHYLQFAEDAKVAQSARERRRKQKQARKRQPSPDVREARVREKRAMSEPRVRETSARKSKRGEVPSAPIAQKKLPKAKSAASQLPKAKSAASKVPKVVQMRFRSTAE